jgi:3-keto-disaccharide hydrolase
MKLAGVAAVARGESSAKVMSLFDGKTLDGWVQVENNAILFTGDGIADPAGFVHKVMHGSDALSVLLRGALSDSMKADLAAYAPGNANAKAVIAAMAKELNPAIAGPIYDKVRSKELVLRAETTELAKRNPSGYQLARLNKLLLEDAYPELAKSGETGWTVKDGAMASTGSGRGVIYTAKDFGRYRLTFTMRHVSGNPDHQAGILLFCKRPEAGERPMDALTGIQFQAPNGGHWDYRPGMNNNGGGEFTAMTKTRFDPHEWSRVEILADASKGTIRMAVAQPVGSKAVGMLSFKDPAAGRVGPIAWQMHNAGLFDEFKDVAIEVDPKDDDLTTVGQGAQ